MPDDMTMCGTGITSKIAEHVQPRSCMISSAIALKFLTLTLVSPCVYTLHTVHVNL